MGPTQSPHQANRRLRRRLPDSGAGAGAGPAPYRSSPLAYELARATCAPRQGQITVSRGKRYC